MSENNQKIYIDYAEVSKEILGKSIPIKLSEESNEKNLKIMGNAWNSGKEGISMVHDILVTGYLKEVVKTVDPESIKLLQGKITAIVDLVTLFENISGEYDLKFSKNNEEQNNQ